MEYGFRERKSTARSDDGPASVLQTDKGPRSRQGGSTGLPAAGNPCQAYAAMAVPRSTRLVAAIAWAFLNTG